MEKKISNKNVVKNIIKDFWNFVMDYFIALKLFNVVNKKKAKKIETSMINSYMNKRSLFYPYKNISNFK
jgi:hypothetical protein